MNDPNSQHMQALTRANKVRLLRAEAKNKLAKGEVKASDLLDGDHSPIYYLQSCTIAELLRSQRRWGATRTRKFLSELQIREHRSIEDLTRRQRKQIAEALRAREL